MRVVLFIYTIKLHKILQVAHFTNSGFLIFSRSKQVLGNFAFWIVLLLGQIVRKIFLGTLSEDEMQHIYDNVCMIF